MSNFYVWKLPKIIRVQNDNSVISHFTSFPHGKRGKFMLTFYNTLHAMLCAENNKPAVSEGLAIYIFINVMVS